MKKNLIHEIRNKLSTVTSHVVTVRLKSNSAQPLSKEELLQRMDDIEALNKQISDLLREVQTTKSPGPR